jgi:membrane-associated protease RseP (regulator of RpoE activity)
MDLRQYISLQDASRVITGRWIRKNLKIVLFFVGIPIILSFIGMVLNYIFLYFDIISAEVTAFAWMAVISIGIAIFSMIPLSIKDEMWERKARKIYKETGELIQP